MDIKGKYDMIPSYEVPTVVKIIETESEMVVAKGWEEGEIGRYWLMDIKFQFCKMKRVIEMDCGDGYTTLWMYLIPLNHILKNAYDGKFYIMCLF